MTSSSNSFIPLSIPHLDGNEWNYVKSCLDTGWVSSAGKFVTDFENALANFIGSPNAVAMVNGTAALHIALLLSDVRPGDEVIVPTLTFIAPINAVAYCNAKPIFMDCDDHLNLDAKKVVQFCEEECFFDGSHLINKKSKARVTAIIPVHIFGNPADLTLLMELRKKFNLKVIEDATEALGSKYTAGTFAGKQVGTIGDFGCFSFNGNKIITTGGGGMLVTANPDLAKRARHLSTQAKQDELYFKHDEVGYNYRLTNLQAAVGLAQMEQLNSFIEIKRANLKKYQQALKEMTSCKILQEPASTFSNAWYYALITDRRDLLLEAFKNEKIESRPVWYLNHLQKPYQDCTAYLIEKASWYWERTLNIPCSISLNDAEISRVVQVIRNL